MDVLLPRTDAGVAVQAAVALVILTGAFFAVRRNRELRQFVTGLAVMTLALFGLRALH
jgi:hypothetical protein